MKSLRARESQGLQLGPEKQKEKVPKNLRSRVRARVSNLVFYTQINHYDQGDRASVSNLVFYTQINHYDYIGVTGPA